MAVTNCHISKVLHDRLVRLQYGLMCNAKPTNELFIESYAHLLGCETIDMTCKNTEPCDLTVCTICQLQTTQNLVTVNPNNGTLFGFTLDLNLIQNAVPPFTFEWSYDTDYWTLDEELVDSLSLFATQQMATDTPVSVTLTDSKGCKITLETLVNYLVGCTDIESLNYNPAANISNQDLCFYIPLTVVVGYSCNEDGDGVLVVQPSGGLPPYTINGNQNGEVIPNGETYSVYVTDAANNTTPIQSGTIVCPLLPPDCIDFPVGVDLGYDCILDGNGNGTGQATLTILVIGGTPPFLISGASDGQIVNDGDEITVFVTDANGCMSAEVSVTIDCPLFVPEAPACEDIQFTFNASLFGRRIGFSNNKHTLTYSITGLPLGVNFQSITLGVTDNIGTSILTGDTLVSKFTSSGSITFNLNANPDPADPLYNLTFAITIKLQTKDGTCEYNYVFNETGTNTTSTTNVLLDTETHIFNP